MGYLDNAGLTYFWGKVKSALAGKQDVIAVGDGLSKEGETLSVTTPVRSIVTQAEFDALPEAQRDKGLYVISDGGSGEGGGGPAAGEVYSTEETKVGTWIDGRPVYQRTFSFLSPNSNAAATVFSIPNIGGLIQYYGYLVTGSGSGFGFIPIPFYNAPSSIAVWCNAYSTDIRMQVTSNSHYSQQCYLTLRYIKTTDTGGTA